MAPPSQKTEDVCKVVFPILDANPGISLRELAVATGRKSGTRSGPVARAYWKYIRGERL